MTQAFCLDPYHDGVRRNDAIAATRNDDGSWTLLVYIADVNATLGHLTRWDREAREKPTGFFVPYLHEVSLSPQQTSPAIRITIQLSAEGKPKNMRYGRNDVQPVAALSFDQARTILDHPEYPLHEGLARIRDVGLLLVSRRKGVAVNDLTIEHAIAQIMTLTNRLLTMAAIKKNRPLVFINNMPIDLSPQEMEALREGLQRAEKKGPVAARAFRSQQKVSFPRTWLGLQNCGHLGLATSGHAWFTSPLHRYVDVLNWRSLLDGIDIDADEPFMNLLNQSLSEMYSIKASYEVRQVLECNLQLLRAQPFASFFAACRQSPYIPFDFERELRGRIASDKRFSAQDAAMALESSGGLFSLGGKKALLTWMAHTDRRFRSALGYLINAGVFSDSDVLLLDELSHEGAVVYVGKHYGLTEDACREALADYDRHAPNPYAEVFANIPRTIITSSGVLQYLTQKLQGTLECDVVPIAKNFKATLIWKGRYETFTAQVVTTSKKLAIAEASAKLLLLLGLKPPVIMKPSVKVAVSPTHTVEGLLGERKSSLKAQLVYSTPVLFPSRMKYRCLAQWTSPITRSFEDFGWGATPHEATQNALWNVIVAMVAEGSVFNVHQVKLLSQFAPKDVVFPDIVEIPPILLPKQVLALRKVDPDRCVAYSDWERVSTDPQLWTVTLTYVEFGREYKVEVEGPTKEQCKNTACQKVLDMLPELELETA